MRRESCSEWRGELRDGGDDLLGGGVGLLVVADICSADAAVSSAKVGDVGGELAHAVELDA